MVGDYACGGVGYLGALTLFSVLLRTQNSISFVCVCLCVCLSVCVCFVDIQLLYNII